MDTIVIPTVVLSILEPDAESTASRLDQAPSRCALIEIRADRLRKDEVAGLVRRAVRPVVVTVRAERDHGLFDGSEEERRGILNGALASGAAFVDVEWMGPLAGLASGPHAGRVILSHHGAPCLLQELLPIYRDMAATPAARLKIVPRATRADQASVVRGLIDTAVRAGRALACFALGAAGMATRLLAPSWGSWATYGAAVAGHETGDGQFTARDLLEVHDVLAIRPRTRLFALVGRPITMSPSPAMHTASYRQAGIDARFLPIEAQAFDEVVSLMHPDGSLALEGLAVTTPFKEEAAANCELGDAVARSALAINTVVVRSKRWVGYNTDGPAALTLTRRHLDPEGAEVAVVGAGGTARALAVAFKQAGSIVTLFNRDPVRGARAASHLGISARPLDALVHARWDVLVQTTPLGRQGEEILPASRLRGRLVLDVVYGPEPTPLIRSAMARGLLAVDGFELLVEQAALQFERMTGIRPQKATMGAAGRSWLQSLRSP